MLHHTISVAEVLHSWIVEASKQRTQGRSRGRFGKGCYVRRSQGRINCRNFGMRYMFNKEKSIKHHSAGTVCKRIHDLMKEPKLPDL